MPRYWIPAFTGMTEEGGRYENAPLCIGLQPSHTPVIPGGVNRRPGIHAEALDSRFRGNDGGGRQVWECPHLHWPPAVPHTPVIPGGVKRRPEIHAEVLDSRVRGNDGGGFGMCGNASIQTGYRPSCIPVIPGGVKRSPGIHAAAPDSRLSCPGLIR